MPKATSNPPGFFQMPEMSCGSKASGAAAGAVFAWALGLRLLTILCKDELCQSPYRPSSKERGHETIPHMETPLLTALALLLLLRLGPLTGIFGHLNFNCRVAWLDREFVGVDSL